MKSMKTILKNTIIPHEGNDYKPHLLGSTGMWFVFIISTVLFCIGAFQHKLLFSDEMLGTIYPNLVATLSNKNREEANLKSLTYNTVLEEAARQKAEDMMIRGYFAHTSPEGLTPWHWIKEAGYSYEYAGENLAINFSDSVDVTKAWMESPGHRANILSSHFTEIGVATVKGYVGGRETVFVVEMFGKPLERAIVFNDKKEVGTTTQNKNTVITASSSEISVEKISTTTVLGIATDSIKEDNSKEHLGSLYSSISFVLSNPQTILMIMYGFFVLVILLTMTLSLLFLKRHHLPRLFMAFSVIIWIIGLFLIYIKFFGGSVILG